MAQQLLCSWDVAAFFRVVPLLLLAIGASAQAQDVPRRNDAEPLRLSPPRALAVADPSPPREADGSVAAGFADLGLRAGEGLLLGTCVSLLWASAGTSTSPRDSSGLIFFGGATAFVALAAPAIDALVLSSIGDASRYRHPVGPLLATSYVSQLVTDAAVIATMAAGFPVLAIVVYAVGSAGGATAMGLVHDASRVEQPPLLSWEVVPPGSLATGARGYQVAF